MTSFTRSRGDVAEQVGSGYNVVFLRDPSRSCVAHLDVPLSESAQPVLMGFFTVLAHGDLFIHRVLLCVLHILLSRIPNQEWIQPSSFDIVPILSLSDRIRLLHNVSAFTLAPAPLEYLGSQSASWRMGGPNRQLVAENIADHGFQILPTLRSFHASHNM